MKLKSLEPTARIRRLGAEFCATIFYDGEPVVSSDLHESKGEAYDDAWLQYRQLKQSPL